MIRLNRKLQILSLLGAGLLLCGSLLYTAWAQTQDAAAGDGCIRCHVGEFNLGVNSAVQHPPFWERQCTVCHLSAGADWSPTSVASDNSIITGTLVDQSPLWRKQQVFGGESQTFEHLVTLAGLNSESTYRFRLLIGDSNSQALASSLWIGLSTQETPNRELVVTQGLSDQIGNSIDAFKLTVVSPDSVIIAWKTTQPLFSWVELQELEGIESTAAAEGTESNPSSTHPPLRDPIEAAINACYQCHPESTLGTSHPVRLYGGRDVRIPDELPTVDGMLTCVTCHDPHGAPGKMLVREIIKTKLCVTCHYKYKNSSPSTMFR